MGAKHEKTNKTYCLTYAAERMTRYSMTVAETIREKLTSEFTPAELVVEDESSRHAGHAGARPGGGTHFNVRIVSKVFEGLSRVERQRRIYAALANEISPDGVHALSLPTLTPAEVWQEH